VRTRRVGTSGLEVGRLALAATGWGRELEAEDCAELLRTFRDGGGNLVVCSPGLSEELVGTLAGAMSSREDLVLATRSRRGALGRRQMLADLDEALDRLRTDRVDLWLLDGADAQTPLEETLAAVDQAVASGRVRYVGVTGLPAWGLASAATWQRALPGQRTPIVVAQAELSLLARAAEADLLPAAAASGVGVLAAAPLGFGALTGKYRGGVPRDSRMAAPLWAGVIGPYLQHGGVIDALLTAADGLGVSPVALALAWVRDRPGVTAPVVGVRTAAQLQAALSSERLTVPTEITEVLDEVSRVERATIGHLVPPL
jgi:aryl-alcohol dehydrogenase-like predicted oxidoreductase